MTWAKFNIGRWPPSPPPPLVILARNYSFMGLYTCAIFLKTTALFSVDFVGQQATIVVEIRGYAIVTATKEISAGESGELINIFPSPALAESEYRIVLSWDTTTDLDIYALGKDR